jgi:hypothetical protein
MISKADIMPSLPHSPRVLYGRIQQKSIIMQRRNSMDKYTLDIAISRYIHFLNFTGSRRVAAGVANKQTGMELTSAEYEELAKEECGEEASHGKIQKAPGWAL